ncbi:MAG: hypothetical protein R3344_03515 [Acidobacteriota bacterium]|nr:hypothetical protein [Acidobacteriota bacterium]
MVRIRRVARKTFKRLTTGFRGPLPTLTEEERRELRSLCIFLGPYRNLTTLTASMLALHPHCQVLNHAGERVFEDKRIDFLSDYTDDKFYTFCKFAITASQGGQHGDYGGSITLSHAFEHPKTREVYERRFGNSLLREQVRSIAWKESLRVANFIREHDLDIPALLERNPKVRFLMPVRNPMDCAVSNARTGHVEHFKGLKPDAPIAAILEALLVEYAWFARLEERFPGSFFSFHQDEVDAERLRGLSRFLDLDAPETWIQDALTVYDVTGKYTHPSELVERYESLVREHFEWNPDRRERLLRFARAGESQPSSR